MAVSNVMSSQSISPILHDEKHLCQSDEETLLRKKRIAKVLTIYKVSFKRKWHLTKILLKTSFHAACMGTDFIYRLTYWP